MTGIQHVSRRDVLRLGLAAAAAAAGIPLLGACGGGSGGSGGGAASAAGGPSAAAGGGQLVIGAFEDGALTPFKQTILPMFEQATGTKVQFLTEPYDSFFAKAFQDGQSKAGQYDIYIMDDPWVPQFAAAGILEDLGAHGITADSDYAPAFAELGYWPPQKGPRIKGFENDQPALIALPTIGDLQTLTYRNDVFPAAPATWDDLVSTAKAGVAANKVKYGFVFRGVKGNPIVTSFYPVFLSFGATMFDDKWNPTFNSAEGKAAADFFVGTLKSIAPPGRRRVRLRPGGGGDPRRRRGGDHPVLGERHQVRRPVGVQGGRQARLRRRPQAGERARPDRHLHPRRLGVGAEQGQRDRVHEVVRLQRDPGGAGPLRRPAGEDPRLLRPGGGQGAPAAAHRPGPAAVRGAGAAAHARLVEGRVHPRDGAQQRARRGERRRGGAWTPRQAR